MTKQRIAFFWRDYKALIILLALGLVVRGVFFGAILWNHGPQGFALPVNEDAGEYVAIAKNLAEHGVFSRDVMPPFSPEQLRTPGYPLLLAFFYKLIPALPFLAAVQNIFFLIGVVLVYQMALLMGQRKGTALIAAGFLALEPTTIYWNNQLTTESMFTVFLLAAACCFISFFKYAPSRVLFYAGFFLGFSLLIRPITQYLGVIFLITLGVVGVRQLIPWKRLGIGAALFILGYGAVVAPWMYRNAALFGTTSVSTMNVGFGKYVKAMQQELGIFIDYANYGGISRTGVERLALVRADALRLIAQHPLLFAKIHAMGLVPFFLGDGYVTTFSVLVPALKETQVVTNWSGSPSEFLKFVFGHGGIEGFIFWFGKLTRLAITVLAAFGFTRLWRSGGLPRRGAVFLLLIIYYFALASGVGSYSRFRFPVDPFIFILVAAGITTVTGRVANAKRLDRGIIAE